MRCQNRWGYAGNLPYISDKRVPKPWFPLLSHPTTHSYIKAVKTRETPRSSIDLPIVAQPETLPRLHRPPQQLAVPHPPHRMRIRCRSRRPARSAAPSSTSKELPRCSPNLSRHLNPHSAVLTCPTGTAAPSPIPLMKPRPTRCHQGGYALNAAFYLLFDLTGLPVLDTEQTWWVSIVARHRRPHDP